MNRLMDAHLQRELRFASSDINVDICSLMKENQCLIMDE
jgi:hypothetical protein